MDKYPEAEFMEAYKYCRNRNISDQEKSSELICCCCCKSKEHDKMWIWQTICNEEQADVPVCRSCLQKWVNDEYKYRQKMIQ